MCALAAFALACMLPYSLMNLFRGNDGRTLLQYATWIAPPVYFAELLCVTSTTVCCLVLVCTALLQAIRLVQAQPIARHASLP